MIQALVIVFLQGVEFVKLVRYGSRDSLTIDLGMAEAEGKKEKDEDFLVQCSQRLPSESEAAEVPTHDAVVALEEEEDARENFNFVLEQQPLDGIPSTLTTFHDLLNEMEAQELLEHEPNAPSDAEQLDDVNNIAAMDPEPIPEDPVVIPEAMRSVEAAVDMPIAVSDNMASSDDQWPNVNHLGFHNSGSKLLVVQRVSESDWYLLWS